MRRGTISPAAVAENKRIREQLARIEATYMERGACRHCGGRVPCWSPSGDVAVGVRHTARTLRARHKTEGRPEPTSTRP